MCFSASVSFSASAVLFVSGIVAIKKTTDKKQIWFASIPFVFAVQQFSEGITWLSFSHQEFESFRHLSTIVFILFAQVIWPFWVPFSFLMIEQNPKRKMWIKYFFVFGIIIAAYVSYCLVRFPIVAYPESKHLKYDPEFPLAHTIIAAIFYFIPTVLPCIVSSAKRMTTLGLMIFGSYIVARIFFKEYALSVWCFFAAIISVMVIYNVHLMRSDKKTSTVLGNP